MCWHKVIFDEVDSESVSLPILFRMVDNDKVKVVWICQFFDTIDSEVRLKQIMLVVKVLEYNLFGKFVHDEIMECLTFKKHLAWIYVI